jgi:hypothetical protein
LRTTIRLNIWQLSYSNKNNLKYETKPADIYRLGVFLALSVCEFRFQLSYFKNLLILAKYIVKLTDLMTEMTQTYLSNRPLPVLLLLLIV